jgi:hypothetical protein
VLHNILCDIRRESTSRGLLTMSRPQTPPPPPSHSHLDKFLFFCLVIGEFVFRLFSLVAGCGQNKSSSFAFYDYDESLSLLVIVSYSRVGCELRMRKKNSLEIKCSAIVHEQMHPADNMCSSNMHKCQLYTCALVSLLCIVSREQCK